MRPGRFQNLVRWQKISGGQSVRVNGLTLTPQSRALIVRFPRGAFIWQRPTALLIEQNGQVQHLSIIDLTRIIQLGLCGLNIIIVIASFVQFSRSKEKAL